MIKAVIFDMDGLLIDSQPAWKEAISEFLARRKLIYLPELRSRVIGSGHREIIELFKEKLGLKGDTDKLVAEMRECFYKHFLQKPKLVSSASEVLRDLSKNYVLSIATSTGPRKKVLEILSKVAIKNYFKTIITGDEIIKGKPDPEIYLYSAEKLNVKPSECLVLEDAINGILAGKKAGMRAYGVNKDEKIRRELKKAGADEVFPSLLEIQI